MVVHTAVPSGIYGSTPVVGLMFGGACVRVRVCSYWRRGVLTACGAVSMATTLTIIPDWFGLVSAATNNGIVRLRENARVRARARERVLTRSGATRSSSLVWRPGA